MQRKWRRAWLRGKPGWAVQHPVTKKNNGMGIRRRFIKKLLPQVVTASLLFADLSGVHANPAGGQVISGAGSIAHNGSTMKITQTTDKLGINWQNFSIAAGEKVQFIQPGAGSVALNRVLGNNASNIYGTLSANGKVFLVNPNGVFFVPGAQVNVGGSHQV